MCVLISMPWVCVGAWVLVPACYVATSVQEPSIAPPSFRNKCGVGADGV